MLKMYVIKIKTIICYFAVAIAVLTGIGIIRTYDNQMAIESAAEIGSGNEDMKNSALFDRKMKKDEVEVPILMYHSILRNSNIKSDYIISEAAFENDLKYLKENGYTTIVIKDLIDFVEEGKSLPQKPIILTFDDGYLNNHTYAFPLLKKYNSKAVLSIIGYYTDIYTASPDENPGYAHVTWQNVKEMINSGLVEMQNHSYNLHTTDMGRNGSKKKRGESIEEYKTVLVEDLGKLQNLFKENTGYVPTTYTYPFGSVSNDSFDIIKEMGFKASLSCESGMNHISRDKECLYMLKRYLRTPKKTAAEILK